MTKTIELTDEQWEALQNGEEVVIKSPAKPKQWEPEGGYWFVEADGSVEKSCSVIMEGASEFGIFYPTKEKAKLAAKYMRRYNRYLAYAIEHWPEFVEIERGLAAYYVVFVEHENKYYADVSPSPQPWIPYGPQEEVEKLVNRLNKGEVVF